MKRRSGLAAISAAFLCALSVASCDAGPGVPKTSATERYSSSVDLQLPLDDYRLGRREEADENRARDLLVQRCMERAGFDWHVAGMNPADMDPRRRRYGVIDPDAAERYGYHPPPDLMAEETGRLRGQVLEQPGAEVAYAGPEGTKGAGCAAQAVHRIAQGVGDADFGLVDDLGRRSLAESGKHPDVRAARRDWRACMRSRGYVYDTPVEAIEDRAWWTDVPTEAERGVATADVDCANQVVLIETRAQAEAESSTASSARTRRN